MPGGRDVARAANLGRRYRVSCAPCRWSDASATPAGARMLAEAHEADGPQRVHVIMVGTPE